jgi:hypothetical protein
MIPATYDFTIWRGTAGPTQGLKVQLKAYDTDGVTLVNIPYQDVRLSIYKRSTLIQRLTLSGGRLTESDIVNAEIEWAPTNEETRLIPKGAKATYELEVWNGDTEIVYLTGTITGAGGINDDENEAS